MSYETKAPQSVPSAQNVILEGRAHLAVSGVSNVVSYDESEIVMDTVKGRLTVRGEHLHMGRLTLENGEATVDGAFTALEYDDDAGEKARGFFARLFG